MHTRPLRIALAGATGAVGRAVLQVLEDLEVEVAELRLLASARSVGQELELAGEPHRVGEVRAGAFRGCDVALLATPREASRRLAAQAREEGCLVVDDSDAFRADAGVPLVVADVNPGALDVAPPGGIVANPNSVAILLAHLLAPLRAAAGLARVHVTALQSVSGSGQRGVAQLEGEVAALMNGREPDAPGAFPHRIAFNVLPQVGPFTEDGTATGEQKIVRETRTILGAGDLPIQATAIRVPVFYGHSLALNLRTERPLGADGAREALRKAPGVKVLDDPAQGVYPMPMLAVNDDAVLVGRVREDRTQEHGLDLFAVGDNLRTGGAANLVRVGLLLASRHAKR
ncbi:MAG TPA: aspartate-semialdehyde dehydrogenase [Anaeromyxobacteraceae bacterium]|nr:aspartate-semialdehyde dehydrogenase [Anaeromyxobacteraceae bacterium]